MFLIYFLHIKIIHKIAGQYVVALLSSGNLIRWNKDMRVVVQIEACPGFTASGVQGTMHHITCCLLCGFDYKYP